MLKFDHSNRARQLSIANSCLPNKHRNSPALVLFFCLPNE